MIRNSISMNSSNILSFWIAFFIGKFDSLFIKGLFSKSKIDLKSLKYWLAARDANTIKNGKIGPLLFLKYCHDWYYNCISQIITNFNQDYY